MDWDDLRFALAIARDGTLSTAAERLGVAHTTVGRRLRQMEDRLGVRLFDATPEGFVPTDAGRDLVLVAERMEADVLALEGRVLGRDRRLTGALRVSTMELLFRGHRAAFTSFMARHPDIVLTVSASDDEVSLPRREADVALRMTSTPPEGLVGRKVGAVEFALYASRALIAKVGPDAPLDAYPWIHFDERLNMRWLDALLAEHAPRAKIALRVDVSVAAMHELIAAGVGVQFLACFEGDADPALLRIGPTFPEARRDLWILTLPDLAKTPRVRAFTEHMAGHLRAPRSS